MEDKDKPKFLMWSPTIEQYLEAYELAKKNGVKPGESMEKYFLQVMSKHKVEPITATDKNTDQILGDLREDGKKVLDLRNIKNKDEDNES